MKWTRQASNVATSDCGRYRIEGVFQKNCFVWNGVYVATSKLVAASSDKDFVKLRCEVHASNVKEV